MPKLAPIFQVAGDGMVFSLLSKTSVWSFLASVKYCLISNHSQNWYPHTHLVCVFTSTLSVSQFLFSKQDMAQVNFPWLCCLASSLVLSFSLQVCSTGSVKALSTSLVHLFSPLVSPGAPGSELVEGVGSGYIEDSI